ncbi:MAG: cytochrome b N-terminal domain-containing protein [Pseudomonadota bacterium]
MPEPPSNPLAKPLAGVTRLGRLAGRLASAATPACARRPGPLVSAWPQYFYRCLGGLALVFFGLQVVSGLLLLFWYRPDPAAPLADLAAAETASALVWGLRRLHAAAGQLMVALVLGHLLRVLWLGAYRPPRQWHWLSGMALMVLTMGQAFSGGLLPGGAPAWSAAASLGLVEGPVEGLTTVLALHLAAPWLMALLVRRHLALVRASGPLEPL